MDILKNNRGNTDFSHLGVLSINTLGYGDVSKTLLKAALENGAAEIVSKQLDQVDYDQLALETNRARGIKLESEWGSLYDWSPVGMAENLATNIADVWRQSNVQGHSVNLSKKLDELLNTEGSWLPLIDQAQLYLLNKKRISDLLETNAKDESQRVAIELEIDLLLQLNSAIEPSIRNTARTNPYLLDIFYETTPGKLFSTKEFSSPQDVLKYYTYDFANSDYSSDLDPSNNFKHMLSTSGVKGLFGTTHKLKDELLNVMWNMKNNSGNKAILDEQLNKLLSYLESANLLYNNKTEDIIDKINTVKKGNLLFDPTKIDPEFKKNFEENELSGKDPKTWVYALPHLGSSYSEIGAMVGQIGASTMLNGVAKGALATYSGGILPLLYATTEAGANLAIAQYMRESETKSEAFDAFNGRVTSEVNAAKIDVNRIQQEVIPLLNKLGYNTEEMQDHEIFSAMLALNIRTSDQNFNKILDDSKQGLDVVRETNEALSFGDYAQSMLFSYGGAYLSKMYGAAKLAKSSAGMTDKKMLASNVSKALEQDPTAIKNLPLLEQANKVLDRTTTRVINKLTNNKITSNAIKNATSTVATLGKAAGISYFTERTEEGQQYIVSKRYLEGQYDNVDNYSLLDGVANALTLGVEANAAYYGLHPNSGLNTDQELVNSMKIGGFTGLFMTGAYATPNILSTAKQVKTDLKLRGLVADNYAEAEKDFKVDLFLKVGSKTGNFNQVYNTLQELKQNKPDGVTDEMIDEDIELAKKVYAYSGSKQTKSNLKAANISENSEDYNKFILNAVRLENRYQQQSTATENSNKKLERLLQQIQNDFLTGSDNKIVLDWLTDQYQLYTSGRTPETIVSKEEFSNLVFNQIAASIENRTIDQLSTELLARENDLNNLVKDLKIDANVNGISSIRKYVDRLKKESSKKVKTLLNNARAAGIEGTDLEVLKQVADSAPALELEGELVNAIAESVVNTGALIDLLEHRNAYLTGRYNGEIDAYIPTWNNLTTNLKQDIINTKSKQAEELGNPIPTVLEIQKEHDATVLSALEDAEAMADKVGLQKSRAVAVFMKDLRDRIQLEEVAKNEKEEQYGTTQEEPTLEQVNLIITEELEAQPEPEPVDVLEPQEEPLLDELKETSEVLTALDKLELDLLPEIDVILEELSPEETSEFVYELDLEEIQFDAELANQEIDLNEKVALEALYNGIEEAEELLVADAVEEVSNKIENGDKIEELTKADESEAEEVKKQEEPASIEEPVEKENKPAKEVVEVPQVDTKEPILITNAEGEQQSDVPFTMLEAEAIEIFVDPETERMMWDPSGNANLSNAIAIDEEALAAQLMFEDNYADSPFSSPMSSLNSPKEVAETPALSDKDKLKKNRIRSTFFFQPEATDIMPITVAGKPLEITTVKGTTAERRPGKELGEQLAIPGWVNTADDVYYVVTSSTHATTNPVDDLAIHMLIEKDGKVYNASLRAINDKLKDDLRYLGLTKEEVDKEIDQLRLLRSRIIDSYSDEYARTGHLPTKALKHVKARNLRISNGTLNNLKRAVSMDLSVPVYRSLAEVEDFGISSDPIEMSKLIVEGKIEFGYGTGPFSTLSDPFTIMQLTNMWEPTEVLGKGYAGKLYFIPKASQTPSQRVTLPIMLAEELHTIPATKADEVELAYDEKGKRLFRANGEPVPMTTAEYIFELLKNPAALGEANLAFLDLLCHNGSRTVTAGFDEADNKNYHFLVRKQLYVFENNKGERILLTSGRKLENDPSKGYRTKYTNLEKLTAAQKRQVVLDISRNIHWNTDKTVLTSPIDERIVKHVINLAEKNPQFDEKHRYELGCKDITFSLQDVGYTKVGNNIVKRVEGADAPLALTWFINQKKIKTDLGQHAFKAPFIYADDIAIKEILKPQEKVEKKVITTSQLVIVDKATALQSAPRTVVMAEPATEENLSKYGLTIPTDQTLLLGRVWAIAEVRGKYKVLLAPKDKVKGIYSTVQGSGLMDFTTAKQWLTDTLGIDPDNVMAVNAAMRMNGDMLVYGVMNVAVDTIHNTFFPRITLSTVAGEGIQYHEGFHYVSLLLLDPLTRQALYLDYVDRNKKAKNFTREEVEEALAEEFRSWMLKETNPTLGYKVIKFFKQLIEFVQKLRGRGLNYTLFKAIKDGKFKESQIDQETLKEFKNAYESGVFYYIPGLTSDDLAKIPHITDSSTFYKIVDSLTSTALAVYGIKSYEDIKRLNVNSIFEQIQDNIDLGWIEEANVPLAKDVVSNIDIFRNKILARLGELSIKEIERLETEEDNKLASETGDNADNVWDKNQGEISKKANVSFSAKLFFYSIPKTEYKFIKDEESGVVSKVIEEVKDPIFGLPVTESFDIVWNKVMENLWDIEHYDDIISRSEILGNTDPFFKVLHSLLTSAENNISVNTLTQLVNTIKSSKNSMTTIDITTDKPSIVPGMSDENIADEISAALKRSVWHIQDSDNLRKIARYPKLWSNAFYTSDNVVVNEDGSRSISDLGFKYMSAKRNAINALVRLILKGNKKTLEDIVATELILKDRFIELCNGLKIPFDQAALDYMLELFVDTNKVKGHRLTNQFISMWEAYGKSFKNTLADITKIYNNKSGKLQGRGVQKSLDRIFTTKDPNALINLMAVAYGNTHPSPEEFSVTGADNSLVYPISENNYMSDLVRWLNLNLNNKRENLLKTPYSKRSLIANLKGKIKLHTLLAINESISGTSRDYFGISPLEDYIAKLVLTFNGHLTLPTMSDKKTWYSISGITLPKNILNRYETSADFTGTELLTAAVQKDILFDSKTLDIMSNYFLDELDSIIDYYLHKDYVSAHPEEYVANYHGKIKNGKMSAGGNGGRFRYFNQLTINGETLYLNRDLSVLESNSSTAAVLDHLKDLQKLLTGNNIGILKAACNTLLLEKTDLEMQKLEKLGVLLNKNGVMHNKLIPHNIIKDYRERFKNIPYVDKTLMNHDIIRSIVGTHIANTIISIEELEKCFVGDPAYYKWKSSKSEIETQDSDGKTVNLEYSTIVSRDVDKIKRLSSVLSTGTNLRTYWGPGLDEKNNTKFTVMNLEDNMVTSTYYPMLLLAFRNSLIRDMISTNQPDLTDNEIIELVNTEEKQEEQYNKLSDSQKKFVDKLSLNSARPYGKEEINQADAAVYIRPAMYRRIVEALGEWSPEVAAAFDMMESENSDWLADSTKYALAMNTLIKPLKMMYFGDHRNDALNLNIPVFDKMAIFPMFKVLAKADNKVLYDRMNNAELGEIDMIAFESAIKVGGRQKIKMYKDEFNELLDTDIINRPSYAKYGKVGNLPTYVQDLSQLRLLLNTDPHEHIERSFGTQAVKICLGNTIDDRIYGENKGRAVSGATIKAGVMDAIKALSSKGLAAILGRFFSNGKLDNTKLSEFLISQAKSSGLSDEFIYGLGLNENGAFRMPLAAISSRNWVESRIISLVNKECIDVNTPGGSAVQMASFGFKATGIRKEEAVDKAFNDGKKLEFVNADGSMDIMLSTNFFRHVVPEEYLVSYAAMRKWLLKEEIIGPNAKPFGIGYRIPTQGLSSTFAFRVVDVLPAVVGDTVVVPDEFTGQTGSDFDVDKLYLATNAYKDGKYVEWSVDEEGVELPYTKLSKEALVNRMLDYYTLIVSDNKNMAETRASIDTLTKLLLTDILPLVQTKAVGEASPFYELMPSFLLSRKEEYTGGKAGIAPFALNSTNHCLTLLVHLQMIYSKGNPYGLGLLDEIKGQDGFRILDWLSAMINAHVDVAKDPYIMALNVNQITYNITNLLLRGGKGKTAFYFLALPILKAYTAKKIAEAGVYGVDEKKFDNQLIADIEREYEIKLRDKLLSLDPNTQQYKDGVALFNGWIVNKDSTAKNAVKKIPTNVESILPDRSLALDELRLIKSLKESKEESVDYLYQQLLAMRAYSELDLDAKIVSELVHRSLIDTKKFGNNLADQMNFKNSYNTFIEDNAPRFVIKDIPYNDADPKFALNTYFGDTFLAKKLYLGTSLPRKILKSQTFTATKLYESIFTSVMGTFGTPAEYTDRNGVSMPAYKHVGSKKLVKNLNLSMESIIRARVTRLAADFRVSDEKLRNMFYGKNTICKLLSGVKQYLIENKDEFPYLVGLDGIIKNDLLNYLQEYSGNGTSQKVDRILLFNSSMNNSVSTENKLISAFSDLLESHDAVIREFANDLALYSYFTSYDNRGVNSFFHLVPVWWKDLHGYISTIKDALNAFSYNADQGISTISESNDVYGYYPSINITMARNLWRDDEIVKRHTYDAGRGDRILHTTKMVIGNSLYLTPTVFATKRTDEFIKMLTGKNSENTQLYRRVASVYYEDIETGKQIAQKSLYQIVPKLGFNDNGYLIYEFLKESLEPSAFAVNDFTSDMIIDTSEIGDYAISKVLPQLRLNKDKYKAVFNPFIENAIKAKVGKEDAVVNTGESITEVGDASVSEVESFGDEIIDTDIEFGSDQLNVETFDDSALAEFEREMSTELFTLGNDMQDIIDFGSEFAAMEDVTPDITESNVETFEDTESLALLGKNRKKECE